MLPRMTSIKARPCLVATHYVSRYRLFEDFMYYVILFIGVLSFLALVAWLQPSRRKMLTLAGQGDQAVDRAGDLVARLLKGERKEDKPCITPIDCVRTKRCAGHCGCR
jgi:hypothetical protein